jgi:hypothetical protein
MYYYQEKLHNIVSHRIAHLLGNLRMIQRWRQIARRIDDLKSTGMSGPSRWRFKTLAKRRKGLVGHFGRNFERCCLLDKSTAGDPFSYDPGRVLSSNMAGLARRHTILGGWQGQLMPGNH